MTPTVLPNAPMPRNLSRHPLAHAWPDVPAMDEDMAAPIVLYEDMVLDGWARYIAHTEQETAEIPVETYTGDDPAAFVVRTQARRWNGQIRRLEIAICALKTIPCRGPGRPPKDPSKYMCENLRGQPEIAALASVSVPTIKRAKAKRAQLSTENRSIGSIRSMGSIGSDPIKTISEPPADPLICTERGAETRNGSSPDPNKSETTQPLPSDPFIGATPAALPGKPSTCAPLTLESLAARIDAQDAVIATLKKELEEERKLHAWYKRKLREKDAKERKEGGDTSESATPRKDKECFPPGLVAALNANGLSEQQIHNVETTYPAEHVQKQIAYVEDMQHKERHINNLAAFLLSAIKNNYASGRVLGSDEWEKKRQRERRLERRKKTKLEKEKYKAEQAEKMAGFQKYHRWKEAWLDLPAETRRTIEQEVAEELRPDAATVFWAEYNRARAKDLDLLEMPGIVRFLMRDACYARMDALAQQK